MFLVFTLQDVLWNICCDYTALLMVLHNLLLKQRANKGKEEEGCWLQGLSRFGLKIFFLVVIKPQ